MSKSEQGSLSDRFKVIPRTLIFITRADYVLLLKGSPQKRLWANLYNGIGGHIERGEDPLSAAKRELVEESSLQFSDLALSGTIMVDTGEMIGICIFVYMGKYESGDLTSGDEGHLEWIAFHDLDNIALVEDIKILLPRLLKMNPHDLPFSALYQYNEKDELDISFA